MRKILFLSVFVLNFAFGADICKNSAFVREFESGVYYSKFSCKNNTAFLEYDIDSTGAKFYSTTQGKAVQDKEFIRKLSAICDEIDNFQNKYTDMDDEFSVVYLYSYNGQVLYKFSTAGRCR